MADVVAKIKLTDGSKLSVGKSFISSLKSVTESTSDASSINYGMLANSGSIEIQDGNGYISKMIDDGILPVSDLDVEVEVDGEAFQQHITTDSDYDTEGNTLNVSLSNFLKDFDVLKYKGYVYQNKPATLYELFIHVLNAYYQYSYTDQLDTFFDSKTLDYIKNIVIEYPSIEYGKTYRQVLDELCTIAQLNMFVRSNKILKFVSARPKYASREEIKTLKWNDVVEDLKYTKTLKNKYDWVEITKTQVSDTIGYNEPLISSNEITSFDGLIPHPDLDSLEDLNSSNYRKIIDFGSSGYYVYIRNYYYNESFEIPIMQNNNLEQITSINTRLVESNGDGTISPKYQLRFTKNVATYNSSNANLVFNDSHQIIGFSGDLGQYGYVGYDGTLTQTLTSRIKATYYIDGIGEISVPAGNYSEKVTVTKNETNNVYNVSVSILVGQKITSAHIDYAIPVCPIQQEVCLPESLTFTIYGNKRTITFSDMSANTTSSATAKTKANITSSKLIQIGTTYNGVEIADIIKENILHDYRNGIASGALTINKNIVELGDLIKCPNDKRVWRVVGSEFHYDGEYLFPLSVMQCLGSEESFGLFDNDGNILYGWSELIEDELITIEDGILKSVTVNRSGILRIPDEITGFAEGVLGSSTYITGVELNDNITSISDSAFRGAKGLTSFDSGAHVTSLGGACLEYCDNLAELKIGPNITYIGNQAFAHNPKLKRVIYSATNFLNSEGNSYFFRNSGTSVGGVEIIVEEGVQTIPDYLFGVRGDSDNTITSVNIKSQNLKDIGEYAFFGTKISTINLPESLASIGESAFEESMIKSIKIPDNVTSIGLSAFYRCSNLENVKLPNGITSLSWNLFSGCSSLKELVIPNSVTDVGRSVLYGCTSIENLEVPLPEIEQGSSFKIQDNLFGGTYGTEPVSLKRIVVKKGASTNSSISLECFVGCSGLEEVIIGSGITTIFNNAFNGITTLKRVIFEDTSGWKAGGNTVDVTDPEQNAIMLTQTYLSRTWSKS